MKTEAYLREPYHFRLQQRDDGGDDGPYWLATVEELPGCMSDGETEAEAMENVRDAMAEWIAAARAEGRPVPEPAEEPDYSGQFRVRMPAELHGALAREANRQGTSLNQLVLGFLAGGMGWGRLPLALAPADRGIRMVGEDPEPYDAR